MISELRKFSSQLDSLTSHTSGSEIFNSVYNMLETSFGPLQGADTPPTTQCSPGVNAAHISYLWKKWELAMEKVKMINEELKGKGLEELVVDEEYNCEDIRINVRWICIL